MKTIDRAHGRRLPRPLFSLRRPRAARGWLETGSSKLKADAAGFTLVELLTGLGLAAVVLTVLVGFFVNFSRANTTQNAAAGAQHTARAGLDYMLLDIRMAGFDPLKTAGAGIAEITATGDKLRFTADRCDLPIGSSSSCFNPEPDGDVSDTGEEVTYQYDTVSRSLRRILYETNPDPKKVSSETLIARVAANPGNVPLFQFLDEADNPITNNNDRGLIRSIIVTLTVEEPAGIRKNPLARTYSARLRLRNIGL